MVTVYKCSTCQKTGSRMDLLRCARCRTTLYCNKDCQTADWRSHKSKCKNAEWWITKRKCRDGSSHYGKLELMTWDWTNANGDKLGWGNILKEESDDLKRKFETEFNGDEEKLYKHWSTAFRWTCCGTGGDMKWGCDHHGSGPKPCTCDFCRMGKPLPDSIWNVPTTESRGLTLNRGPDPRSYNAQMAAINVAARLTAGMPM